MIRGALFRVGERGAHRVARSRLGFTRDRLGFALDRLGFFFRGVLLRLGVLERRGELREGHLRVLELHSRPVRLRLRGLRLRRHQRRSCLRVGGGVFRRRRGSVGVAPPRLRLRERRDEPLATLLGLEKRRGESVGAFGFLLCARKRGFRARRKLVALGADAALAPERVRDVLAKPRELGLLREKATLVLLRDFAQHGLERRAAGKRRERRRRSAASGGRGTARDPRVRGRSRRPRGRVRVRARGGDGGGGGRPEGFPRGFPREAETGEPVLLGVGVVRVVRVGRWFRRRRAHRLRLDLLRE